jgi:hypothetical protein
VRMSWVWSQSAGTISHDGSVVGHGYSGADLGKNNPGMEDAVGVGPIPTGLWDMTGIESNGPTGPFTIILVPEPGTDTCGRSAFRIHGDSINSPGTASHGCIILARPIREQIWNSGDHALEVVV